jgi:RNA recognition motif-containing protein
VRVRAGNGRMLSAAARGAAQGIYINVGNIDLSATTSDLFSFFSSRGAPPVDIWLAHGEEEQQEGMNTFAVLKFATSEHVTQALELSGMLFLGRAIRTSARDAAERRMPQPNEVGMRASVLYEGRIFLYAHNPSGIGRSVCRTGDWQRRNRSEGSVDTETCSVKPDAATRLLGASTGLSASLGDSRARAGALSVRHDKSDRARTTVPGGVWVGGLPKEVTADMIRSCFGRFTKVARVCVLAGKHKGGNGSARVILHEHITADNILGGEYGPLTIPGCRHVIEPRDMQALETARDARSCLGHPSISRA